MFRARPGHRRQQGQGQPLKDLQLLSSPELPSRHHGHTGLCSKQFHGFFTSCGFTEGFYKHINSSKPKSCTGHCPALCGHRREMTQKRCTQTFLKAQCLLWEGRVRTQPISLVFIQVLLGEGMWGGGSRGLGVSLALETLTRPWGARRNC